MFDGLNIYHIVNFLVLVITALIGWKKLKPRDWTVEIIELQTHKEDCDKSLDRIEKSIEAVKDILMREGR